MNSKIVLTTCALLAGLAWCAPAASLPDSGTNTLQGTLRFANTDAGILARLGPPGDEGLLSWVMFAYTDPPESLQTTKYFVAGDRLSHPYELTVTANDVPLMYHLYAYVVLDGGEEEYWTATQTAAPLTSNSPPATVDLDECVALLELRYVDSAGLPVAAAGGRAWVTETATGVWRARYLHQPPGRTENFLVVPSGVEIELAVEVDVGSDIYADRVTHRETHIATYACDERPVLTIQIPDAGSLGSIIGQANLVGEIELATDAYDDLLGRPVMKAAGPSGNQRYAALAAESPGPDAARSFSLGTLAPSTPAQRWNVWTEMHFGAGYRFEYFRSPGLGEGLHNPGVSVTGGAATDLRDTFVMKPARLTGQITLTGPPDLPGQPSRLRDVVRAADYDLDMNGIPDAVGATTINGSYVSLSGVDELASGATLTTAGGSAIASFEGAFNSATVAFEGDYEVVLGMLEDQPGLWRQDALTLSLYHAGDDGGPLVDESLSISEAAPWQGVVASGERASKDLSYGFAEVCLRIRSPAPFFYPRVINTYGGLTNGTAAYSVILQSASAPPYTSDAATNEALVTFYLPEGDYSLRPAISVPDPDGGVSDLQLPPYPLSVTAGERVCVEECLRLIMTPPVCTTNFGFLAWAEAFSCEATLTNLSLMASPVGRPDIRLGYSDIRILEPIGVARANLRTGHGLFPEFDGFNDPSLYQNILYTAEARDNRGRHIRRQIVAHYDFTPPTLNCLGNTNIVTDDPAGARVDYLVTATDDRPEPLWWLSCVPPTGSLFPVGVTTVNCTAVDLCRNTNTCAFTITVGPPDTGCTLQLALTQAAPPTIELSWTCGGVLQCAPDPAGPWEDIVGAVSPYAAAASGAQKFYRVRVP